MSESLPSNVFQKDDLIDGKYLVHEVIRGGTGIVYLCLDFETQQFCALKTLQPLYLHEEARRNDFERCALISARLGKHPNIVWCLDYQEIAGQPFMILEWVAGEQDRGAELSDWLKHGALDLRLALNFAIDICQGMIHAAQHGVIVHRDIKPDNLLIAAGRVAKITDFGLARTHDVTLEVRAGKGTPFYMAPEQWQNRELDVRTDIYATGCTIYEMVTGQKPFVEEEGSKLRDKHLQMPVSWPEQPVVPTPLQTIIEKCIAKSPDERFQSFEELRDSLVNYYSQTFQEAPRAVQHEDLTVNDYYTRALLYRRVGRLEDAIQDFTAALRLSPDNPELLSYRAIIRSENDQSEEAVADIERALELSDDTHIDYLAGIVYRHADQYQLSIEHFKKVLDAEPNHAGAHANMASSLYLDEQYGEAIAEFTRAVNIEEAAQIYYLRGLSFAKLDRYEDAVRDYTRCLHFGPDAEAYAERGCAYHFHMGRYKDALGDFDRAIQLDPQQANFYAYRGNVYKVLQLYPEALRDLDQALELGIKERKVYKDRGYIYLRARKYELALDDFNQALALDDQDIEAYINRACVYRALERFDEAEADHNRSIEINPDSVTSYVMRAIFYLERKQYMQALIDIDHALTMSPESADLYFIKGNVLSEQDRPSEALAAYHMAIGYHITYSAAYNNRGIAQLKLQRYIEAMNDFIVAISYNPQMVTTYINIGILKEANGDLGGAIHYFNLAAQMGHPMGLDHLRRVASEQHMGMILIDPIEMMRQAILEAESLEGMRLVVRKYPYMLDKDFPELLAKMFDEDELAYLNANGLVNWLWFAVAEQSG